MNGYNFTERVRRVLARAREEASDLGNPYVGPEHQLLGMLADDGVGTTVLVNLEVDPDHAADVVRDAVRRGKPKQESIGPDLPYTREGKRVLEFAMSEARDLNHSYVGTEHLLLGILSVKKGTAAQALQSFGVTLEIARAEVLRILGGVSLPPSGEKPNHFSIILHYSNGASVTKGFSSAADAATFLSAQ
jgi:ATP-dependent Clp protease ATP-binding subunit ClpC